jgi:adenine-specific DNA methylase
MKRSIGHLFPELFSTPLTPKNNEILEMASWDTIRYSHKTQQFFEDNLKKAFKEIHRVLKPYGVSTIIFAHKSSSGWETLINSLLDSGLVVTAAWSINSEMKARLRANESAVLASSIYMVARKQEKKGLGFYKEIKRDLRKHLNTELDKLWNEGVSGADFFISAIGSAIEVFGKYQKIVDDGGNTIHANKLLDEIRKIVTDYAVKQVLHNGFSLEISEQTRFYLLWRWAYAENKVHFDDARKLAQSVGIDLSKVWNKGFIQKDKEFIRILGPSERNINDLSDSKELVDVLHKVLLLWNNGRNDEILDVLGKLGLASDDVFYKVAQAISESLPNDSKEKKWLEGFLAGRTRITKKMRVDLGQRSLD